MAASRAVFFDHVRIIGSNREETIARVTLLATLLDSAFRIPGLRRRIGLDALIGLAPGIGDLIAAALGSYIIWEARRLGLPRRKIARMIVNLAFDTAIGTVPVAGDAFDIFFKANMRNLRIIHEHFGMQKRGPREH